MQPTHTQRTQNKKRKKIDCGIRNTGRPLRNTSIADTKPTSHQTERRNQPEHLPAKNKNQRTQPNRQTNKKFDRKPRHGQRKKIKREEKKTELTIKMRKSKGMKPINPIKKNNKKAK